MADLNFTDTLIFRFIAVLVMVIGLAIPLALVWSTVEERSRYEYQASREISTEWGYNQTLVGPFLNVQLEEPVKHHESLAADSGDSKVISRYFTPSELTAVVKTSHEVRSRGLSSKPAITTNYQLEGVFSLPDSIVQANEISSCAITLVSTRTRAIRDLSISYNGVKLRAEPQLVSQAWDSEGLQAWMKPEECKSGAFSIALTARGTDYQRMAMVGDESSLTIRSSWPHPKFVGRQLPDSHDITDEGFTATWTSIALARGYPSTLSQEEWIHLSSDKHTVGYELFEPVTIYTVVARAVKYGFLVVGVTLLAIFCFDLMFQTRLHVIQYAVTGAGLALFYLLFLALAEHLGFVVGYSLAALVLTAITTIYTGFSTRNTKLAITVSTLLVTIFSALYACLVSADYALVIGSLMLVALLIGLMYATRGLAGRKTVSTDDYVDPPGPEPN